MVDNGQTDKGAIDVLGTVVLIHGFFRSGRNMRYLARKLEEKGYRVIVPTLPAIFGSVRECSEKLAEIINGKLPENGVVHFVGHSMGGLVIRDYLSRHIVSNLGKVVMMGTPNGGSPYANLLLKLPFFRYILKSLPDTAVPGRNTAPPINVPAPEIGIIIGKTDFFRRLLLRGDYDGLVYAESVRRINAIDELRVPFPHESIHWRACTAEAVASFLETGKFSSI